MSNISSTFKKESKLYPGVSFTVVVMTEGRRRNLRLAQAESQSELKGIVREMETIQREQEEVRDLQRLTELTEQFDLVMSEKVNPAWLKWGCTRIEGLFVDEKELGVVDYLDWPSDLFAEVVNVVRGEGELGDKEVKNSELPTTSGIQEVGRQTPSIAGFAREEDILQAETV